MRCWSAARPATPPDPAPRIRSGLLVGALLRRIAAEGGQGTVLAKGDAESGAILIVAACRGTSHAVYERVPTAAGYAVGAVGPADLTTLSDYIGRRRRGDPDLWVVELDGDCDLPRRLAHEVLG